jgi:hypothetical protein
MKQTNIIAVIYLAWLPYGISHFETFINSYIKYNAFYDHELIIVFNGLACNYPNKPEEYLAFLESVNIKAGECFYFQEGQDIEIYKNIAALLKTEFVLFFNTYSELLAEQWLEHYVQNFKQDTGIISASGSFQSYYSSVFQKHPAGWEVAKGFLYNFRKYKLFFKAFVYWRFLFKPFPSPTIRTNAFMVRRKEFLIMKSKVINTKFKAYQFENGRKGMTNFFLSRGMRVLVLDRNGKTYEPAEWKRSSTFWIDEQENLLVADNQTRIYGEANQTDRKEMTRLAWGKQ